MIAGKGCWPNCAPGSATSDMDPWWVIPLVVGLFIVFSTAPLWWPLLLDRFRRR